MDIIQISQIFFWFFFFHCLFKARKYPKSGLGKKPKKFFLKERNKIETKRNANAVLLRLSNINNN